MLNYRYKTGFTLTELMVVLVIATLLIGIGVPAAKEILRSFESSSLVGNVIGAALSGARAIAAKEQKYAGVRFQQDVNGNQYMIFIVHDPAATDLAPGFRRVENRNPMKLPQSVGVMDLRIRTDYADPVDNGDEPIYDGDDTTSNENIDEDKELTDTTTFSIVFSPAGKLVIHNVRVRNKDGATEDNSNDDVFNTKTNVTAEPDPVGMFVQDYYAEDGLGAEPSRNSFIVYDKNEFAAIDAEKRWKNYLQYLEIVYVNPYTGEIVNK